MVPTSSLLVSYHDICIQLELGAREVGEVLSIVGDFVCGIVGAHGAISSF